VSRPSVFSVEDKVRLVLAVISGEMSMAEAARRGKASEQSISTWKRQFLEGGKAGLVEGGKSAPNARERQLLEEVEELKAALGERTLSCGSGSAAPSIAWALRGARGDPGRGGDADLAVREAGRGAGAITAPTRPCCGR